MEMNITNPVIDCDRLPAWTAKPET